MADINIKDIARLSGVGIATVSRVLNQTGAVSEKTRKRVMDVIEQYHYIPNSSARNLKLTRSKNIGVFVKYMSNPFFYMMLEVIEEELTAQGYSLLVQDIGENQNEMDVAISEAMQRNLCGVILMGGSFDSYTSEKFRQLEIPCVLLTVSAPGETDAALYSSVTIDDEKEGYRAVRYLIEQGHRKIGFLYRDAGGRVTPNILRYQGYVRALTESGLEVEERLIATNARVSGLGYRDGFRTMKLLMQLNPDMTAVFAFSDVLAIGAAKAVFAMGKRIPEDISVVGFDGIEMTEFYNPALDTMCQPAAEMALAAVSMLRGMMNGEGAGHRVFDASVLKRGSVRRLEQEQKI
ncbi:MAG: LacI family transcriptional regulator [Lachnospiraceae bacterium]|nr:LacI family transcriptional regulator [Lachnospiraceae bacterium]